MFGCFACVSSQQSGVLLIGGSQEQICVSGVFDVKPSQLPLETGSADYQLLCFSISIFFFPDLDSTSSFGLVKKTCLASPPLPPLAIRPSAEPANHILHSGVGGNDGSEAPVAVMTHYGGGIIIGGAFCSRPLAATSPSGAAAFILPRRDCN